MSIYYYDYFDMLIRKYILKNMINSTPQKITIKNIVSV